MDSLLLRRLGLFVCVAALLLLPSFLWGPGESHSDKYNFIWTSQFGTEMARGNLYPRWLPGSFEGLGSPAFYFYPPLAYWVAGAFDAVGLSTLGAINMAAFIALALSGITMHHWLAAWSTRPRLGAILYMVAPYHLMDFYIRGALAEFFAFVWLPLIALGIHRLPERRGVVMLALSYAGLILTHLPLAMLASFFLIAPLAIHALLRNRALLTPMLVAGTLGVALSGFYLLGALTLQGDISSALIWTPVYRPDAWLLLAPGSLLKDMAMPMVAAGMAMLALQSRSVWTPITLVAAVNAMGLIPFLWDIEPFTRAQFPWRLLCIVEFAGITALLHRRPSAMALGLGCGLVVSATLLWAPRVIVNLATPVPYAQFAHTMPDAPEYLPADFDPSLVIGIEREADLRAWRDLPRGDDEFMVARSGPLTLPRAAFPIWRVVRNGEEVPYQGPFIHFDASPGLYRIERRMIWQEPVGAAISALALLLLCAVGVGMRRSSASGAFRLHHPSPSIT